MGRNFFKTMGILIAAVGTALLMGTSTPYVENFPLLVESPAGRQIFLLGGSLIALGIGVYGLAKYWHRFQMLSDSKWDSEVARTSYLYIILILVGGVGVFASFYLRWP